MRTICEKELHACGIMPVYKTAGAACADVALPYMIRLEPQKAESLDLMIRFEGMKGPIYMYPRSSLLIKHKLISPVSVIDEDYTGNIHFIVYNPTNERIYLEAGTRVAQLQYEYGDEDWPREKKVREDGGLGSTGV